MKRLFIIILAVLIMFGCATVEPDLKDDPIQPTDQPQVITEKFNITVKNNMSTGYKFTIFKGETWVNSYDAIQPYQTQVIELEAGVYSVCLSKEGHLKNVLCATKNVKQDDEWIISQKIRWYLPKPCWEQPTGCWGSNPFSGLDLLFGIF